MDYDKLKSGEYGPYGSRAMEKASGDQEGRTVTPYGRVPHNVEGETEPPFYYSAYGIACKHGFVGTEEEWLASLRGATGDKGDPGAGITNIVDNGDGTLTITYADGESVTTGSLEGPQGETGPEGPDGNGIASVTLTSGDHSPGTTDTYTITYDDGDTDTFTVYNGADGAVTSVNSQTGDVTITVPSNTSDLNNDSGFITADPTVKQNYPDPTSFSYWRPLVVGKSSASSKTGAFSEQTDEVYTFSGIRAQPSTATIKASTFDGTSVQIPYATVDNTSTSTAYTATVPGITELRDGTMVLLKNGVITSAAGFTININNLGAKPVYTNLAAATAESTKFNVNYTMLFIYDEDRVTGGCWICYNGYDSNTNTIAYQVRGNNGGYTVKTKCGRYRILFTSADGTKFVPANTDEVTSAAKTHTTTTEKIDPFGRIVYYGSSTVVAANGTPGVTVLWNQYTFALGYSFNTTNAALTLSYPAPVYVKCTPQSDGSAIIDGTTPYVQTLPSTADGKIYIFLGIAYSATSVEMFSEHPVYEYKDGCIRLYTNAAASGASIASTTAILKGDGNGNAVAATAGTDYSLLPAVTAADNGKFLRVVNGAWAAVSLPSASGVSF